MSKPVFEDLFAFKGRRNRISFILGFLFFWISIGVFVVAAAFGGISYNPISEISIGILIIGAFGFYLLSVNFIAQRLRDLGHSGWWSIGVIFLNIGYFKRYLVVFKIIGLQTYLILPNASILSDLAFIAVVLYLMVAKGKIGENKYGPDPLGTKS
jgi:uncharacterized membrane protein YhaH (DUF805 family)